MINENIEIGAAVETSVAPEITQPSVPTGFEHNAAHLTKRGLSVIPLRGRSKEPAVKDWPHCATTDSNQIKKWHEDNSNYNVGVVAKWDGFWFLDIDDARLEKSIVEDTCKTLPATFSVRTSKGKHLYFRHTQASRSVGRNKFQVKDQEGKLLGDVQLNNAYVVGPGSTHASGKRYEVIDASEIVEAPEWLVNWLKKQCEQNKSQEQHAATSDAKVKTGGRDNFLFIQACALRKSGLSEKAALLALQTINTEQCEPPLEQNIVKQKIESAYKKKPDQTGTLCDASAQKPQAPPPAVNGATLLSSLEHHFSRYAVLEKGLTLVLALWSLSTHLFAGFDTFPYLAITSPTKRCGKTRTAELLELVCANADRSAQISPAALFRTIENMKPTLIMDEAECLSGHGETTEMLRAILNVGYRQGGKVRRTVKKNEGGNFDVEGYETFCPKVIILIGNLTASLSDRCIPIRMRRRTNEKLDRFRFAIAKKQAAPLKDEMAAWAIGNSKKAVDYFLGNDLAFLEDRDAELWLPLFAVLAIADPSRTFELQQTAAQLSNAKAFDEPTELGLKLLADLKQIFTDCDEDQLCSQEMVTSLKEIEESPWKEYGHGKGGLSVRNLAELLRPFEIEPQNVRVGESKKVVKGYKKASFEDAWHRYVAMANAPEITGGILVNAESSTVDSSGPGEPRAAQVVLDEDEDKVVEVDVTEEGEIAPPVVLSSQEPQAAV